MIYYIATIIIDTISIVLTKSYDSLNIFFPLIFISSIPIIYQIVNKKVFFISLIIIGIIYDLLFSFIFLINTSYFILYYLFLYTFSFDLKKVLIKTFIISILGFIMYDFYVFIIINLLNYKYLVINDFYYKIEHSLFINIIYIIVSLIIMKSRILGSKNSKY